MKAHFNLVQNTCGFFPSFNTHTQTLVIAEESAVKWIELPNCSAIELKVTKTQIAVIMSKFEIDIEIRHGSLIPYLVLMALNKIYDFKCNKVHDAMLIGLWVRLSFN